MFLGTHTPRLDDKGRLALPAKFRPGLEGGLVICKGQEHCLYVYPTAEFHHGQANVTRGHGGDPAAAWRRHRQLHGRGRQVVGRSVDKICRAAQCGNHA